MSADAARLAAICYTKPDSTSLGANRKQTNWRARPPSFLCQLETAENVEQLGVLRALITMGLARDHLGKREFVPDERTVVKWAVAQWTRAIQLLLTAPTGNELVYRYNFMLTWPKSEVCALQLEQAFYLRAAQLPTPNADLPDPASYHVFNSEILTAAYTKP